MDDCSYYNFWGKADQDEGGEIDFHLLVYHSLDVATVGKVWLTHNNSLLKRV